MPAIVALFFSNKLHERNEFIINPPTKSVAINYKLWPFNLAP